MSSANSEEFSFFLGGNSSLVGASCARDLAEKAEKTSVNEN